MMSRITHSRHRIRSLLLATALGILLTGVAPLAMAALGDPGLPPESFDRPPMTSISSLGPYYSATGQVTLSMDGLGTNAPSGIVQADKPSSGTVLRAFLVAASTGYTSATIPDGAMTVEGVPINWDASVPTSIFSNNYIADVTTIVKPVIDAAPAGLVDITVGEGANSSLIDGSILAVIFNAPEEPREYTAVIFFGAQDIAGDDFAIGLSEGASPLDPDYILNFSLGISYGYQGSEQSSHIDVNGIRMTTSAGGQDDGEPANGALITVGGIGDSTDNPADPNSGPNNDPRQDDELYNLKPFVSDGAMLISVHTINPSNDDNIFFGGLLVSGGAVVGEGALLTPNSATVEIGNMHTATATLQDSDGNRIVGRNVHFEVTAGPNAGTTFDQLTDANGQAFFSYAGAVIGIDTIEASFVNSSSVVQYSNAVNCEWIEDAVDPDCLWVDATVGPLGDTHDGRGVSWCDFDNDGDDDLFLANNGPNKLLRNDGGGVFVRVITDLGDTADSRLGCWGDYDNDGDFDLYIVNYNAANVLLRNDGGAFTDVTDGPLGDTDMNTSGAWADWDLDGDLDLYLTTDDGRTKLLRNDGGTFVDLVGDPASFVGWSRGCAFGDYDNDGDPDLYVTIRDGANKLFRNDLAGGFTDVSAFPVDFAASCKGAAWGDYDNDGWLDLYVVNKSGANRLFHNEQGLFVDVTDAVVGDEGDGRTCAWGDYDNDGWLDLFLTNVDGGNKMFHNIRGTMFEDATCGALISPELTAWGTAFSDYDNDGDLDLYVSNHSWLDVPNRMYRNILDETTWLRVNLVGTTSNRFGLGARIEVTADGMTQLREIAPSGYLSQSSTTAQFGLGDALTAVVKVTWPSGMEQTVPVDVVNGLITVTENSTTGAGDVPLNAFRIGNYPNPFNPSTTISFALPTASQVQLRIFDVGGRLVKVLIDNGQYVAGEHQMVWNGRTDDGADAPSGLYFYEFEAGSLRATHRMTLIK